MDDFETQNLSIDSNASDDRKRSNEDDTLKPAGVKVSRKDDIEWKITFDQTQGIRTLVDVVGNILTRVNFRVTHDSKKDTYFLCIDSIDPQHVCMIQARLNCEKIFNLQGTETFCVDTTILNTLLKNVPAHYSLDLVKRKSSADIYMRTYESLSNSHETHYIISTIVDDSETMQLTDMQYKYTIEIDLGTLRQIVKMSQALRANHIEFAVKEPAEAKRGVSRTTFSIASSGDASQEHRFNSATVTEPGSESETCVIRAATDSTGPDAVEGEAMLTKYSDAFSTQYLNYFLKSMERQIITMKLSQDKPLILHYPLGAERSYICFVLAPKTTD
jgi:hypothetical protein